MSTIDNSSYDAETPDVDKSDNRVSENHAEENSVVWKLRILNTKYKDAEVKLTKNQLLGSNEHKADLVIDASGIQDEHANILVSDEGISLQAVSDNLRIHVNGQIWDESQKLPSLTPVHLGELVIMVAEDGMSWPNSIPDFDKPQQPQDSEKKPVQPVVVQSQSSIFKRLSIGALLISVLSVVVYSQSDEDVRVEVIRKINFEQVREQMDLENYPHLVTNWNEQLEQMNLSGYVETSHDKNALLDKVDRLNITFTSEIRTMDEIKAATRFILKNLELPTLDIKSGETAGSLIFVTDRSNPNGWKRARQILQRDVPGLMSWTQEVPEEKPALEQLKELLANSTFGDKLILEDRGNSIHLIGKLSGPEMREYWRLEQTYVTKFNNDPRLILSEPEVENNDNPNLNLNIRAVRLGEVPYLILSNGQKYFEGARLPNGERVASIESSGIYLKNDRETYIVYFDSKS